MNAVVQRTSIAAALVLTLAGPSFAQIDLPAGTGRDVTVRACLQCHGTEKLAGADNGHWPAFGPGKSREEWQRILAFMHTYKPMSAADTASVLDYLATAFPGPARPAGVRVAGPIEATIREWKVTPGTRPHDPAVAPDGGIWYTGQAGNRLGRLDPATGQFKEYPLQADNTRLPYGVGPHGLVADTAGSIWYTGQQDGHLGKLDPATGAITKYRMPERSMGGPHTPVFDQHGTLWFTMQQANMVGRLVTATGEMTFAKVPTPKSEPYGIVPDSKGVPFFTQLMGNRIGSVDPATMQVREYPLGDGTGPRRLAITADDMVFYTDYARGKLGRLDPQTGRTKEWPSPSGALSQPYAIAAVGRIVWYVEGNTIPNMVVRFDPATETFQTWPLESGGGVVRHMVVAPDGRLWMVGSEVDTVGSIEVKPAGATH